MSAASGARTRRHLRANVPVLGWLLATVVVAFAHRALPEAGWLLVHLLLLGAVTSAILVWSAHFTDALLRRRVTDRSRRWAAARLVALQAAVVLVVAGVLTGRWTMTLVGAALVGGVVAAHGAALALQVRSAGTLAGRFTVTIRYYVAASCLLPLGAAAGVLLARGLDETWHSRVVAAHGAINLLGFVALTVVGTLLTLWPTILRTRVPDGAERATRRALPVLLTGLAVVVGGALGGLALVAAAGVLVYLAGLGVAGRPLAQAARSAPPRTFPALSVAWSCAWLLGGLVALAVGVGTAGTWTQAAGRVGVATVPLVVGFALQVLLGALSSLGPVVLGGGPARVRASVATVERGATVRLVLLQGGLLLCVLPVPSLVRAVASMLVLGSALATVVLLVAAVRGVRRGDGDAKAPATDVARRTPVPAEPAAPERRRTGAAALATASLVLAVAAGVALDPAAAGLGPAASDSTTVASGRTTTVRVEAHAMRFEPASITVPAGDRLVIEVTNVDTDVHDLTLDSGHTTGRLSPGATVTLVVDVVGRDLEGWCSVVGHRQMGMVLGIDVTGEQPLADAGEHAGHAGHTDDGHADGEPPGPAGAPDDAAALLGTTDEPGPGVDPYDATLPPLDGPTTTTAADGTRTHRVRLDVSDQLTEVAPGVTQTLWTFGGVAPGPTLHGRIGDRFEVTLVNDGSIGHSIDFHAGALAPDRPMRTIAPGETLEYTFTATRAGIWMYHCSTMPMSAHIANGMFGAVVIEPDGLAPVDREYVLVQSELYLGAPGGEVDAAKIAAEAPDLVVFNGYANQYDHAPLQARVGERVRIWVLAAGPSRGTSFHVVGGQFDTVFHEGVYTLRPGTQSAAAGGGAQALGLTVAQGGFVELELPEAGTYPFVSHSMVDAERGAHGLLTVVDP
ncbi:multicopper oxidase domain-containing protein [Sanguibacter suaedae]|uniref:Copper-containing nitrite reductase n=1 Tax=Sanguibacter suaedae TaxID=2795737 RepID=A0A934I3T7_9MICO|nr:multicopper oxidase domain-containing protein [Sanguibacter suaedae]MBI9114723.1 multicopper oxidase domain-containing protein [Sanguibacter suaedae]